jgi:hypothetical protein
MLSSYNLLYLSVGSSAILIDDFLKCLVGVPAENELSMLRATE